MGYDIIGDVHGHADKLIGLLSAMGYDRTAQGWQHPERRAIFVGDFIDRGPQGVETVRIVRDMVEAGAALAVMGNHELNAIAWHTPDALAPGDYLRPHHRPPSGAKNRRQHQAFLAQVESQPDLHADLVRWFMTLPLWIDLPELRVVHACWHDGYIRWLGPQLRDGRCLTMDLLRDAVVEPEAEPEGASATLFSAVETLLKGVEIQLPSPHHFFDKDQVRRDCVRARWWDRDATTFRQLALDEEFAATLPDLSVPMAAQAVSKLDKPTFFGHYWMKGSPAPLHANAACVDYSAGAGGPLVAYRWSAGQPLSADGFFWAR